MSQKLKPTSRLVASLAIGLLIAASWSALGFCQTAVSTPHSTRESEKFPYQAMVASDATAVRSGPGKVHYATGELEPNTTVEVWRHDPGGWCAIRPPRDSFSLVPAATLDIVADGVGEIVDDGTQAWVGTQLGPVENPLWQIKLKSGERVEILGETSWPNPEGHSTVWYQIAPPAGEFRWIHIDGLKLPPNMLAQQPQQQANDAPKRDFAVQQATYQQAIADPDFSLASKPTTNINSGWRQATQPIDRSSFDNVASNNQQPGSFDRFASLPIAQPVGQSSPDSMSRQAATGQRPPERLASANVDASFGLQQLATPPASNPFPGTTTSLLAMGNSSASSPLTTTMTELELKLNNEMLKEPNQWRLIDLQKSAQSIANSNTNPIERVQAQKFLAKLDNYRKIRTNYLAVFQASAGTATGAVGSGLDEDVSLGTIYDAHGWLNELVRGGGTRQPTYVLQDKNGKITHHVSPMPGLNLSSYLKTKVGIIGKRGYHTELKLDHVTAERVIELNE